MRTCKGSRAVNNVFFLQTTNNSTAHTSKKLGKKKNLSLIYQQSVRIREFLHPCFPISITSRPLPWVPRAFLQNYSWWQFNTHEVSGLPTYSCHPIDLCLPTRVYQDNDNGKERENKIKLSIIIANKIIGSLGMKWIGIWYLWSWSLDSNCWNTFCLMFF